MAHRGKLTRIEPTFDGPARGREPSGFSVGEEDRVVPSSRKPAAARKKSSKGAQPRNPAPAARRLFRPARRLLYWCFVLAIWGGIAAAGIVVYYGARMPSVADWAVPDRPPNVKIVSVDGKLVANRGMTGGEAVGLHEMSPYIPHGRHRHRGPPLLFAFRHRPDRPRRAPSSAISRAAASRRAARR